MWLEHNNKRKTMKQKKKMVLKNYCLVLNGNFINRKLCNLNFYSKNESEKYNNYGFD